MVVSKMCQLTWTSLWPWIAIFAQEAIRYPSYASPCCLAPAMIQISKLFPK